MSNCTAALQLVGMSKIDDHNQKNWTQVAFKADSGNFVIYYLLTLLLIVFYSFYCPHFQKNLQHFCWSTIPNLEELCMNFEQLFKALFLAFYLYLYSFSQVRMFLNQHVVCVETSVLNAHCFWSSTSLWVKVCFAYWEFF